ALDNDGQFHAEQERWEGYFGRTLVQLMWWANAAKAYKAEQDPTRLSPAINQTPSQRDAPPCQ
ncbi:MAG TPA: NADPH-dependent oxidoreductase, partial [Halomonas sp.]|nr:NADPH-dependent oxidoreductase [Halomonas sp.]HCL23987.1 NADPH-dependent oxidoreductase [Halomonas sp.]